MIHDAAAKESAKPWPAVCFATLFWGPLFAKHFADLLVASLLAPGNIPGLRNKAGSRFLVCTTPEDFAALSEHPNVKRLRALIEIEHVLFPESVPGEDKMKRMSRGHASLAARSFALGATTVFLSPDVVVSDGTVRFVEGKLREGYAVVLAGAVRFAEEGFVDELVRRRFLVPGEPAILPARALLEIGLRHLHSETLRFDFDCRDFAIAPSAVCWRVPGRSGIVMHCFSWAILAFDYAKLPSHNPRALENWTIDGDYVHGNFGSDLSRIHVVDDSDDCMLISFTSEAELTFLPFPERRIAENRYLFGLLKLWFVRKFYASADIDPQKRLTFAIPLKWHADGTDGSAWRATLARGRRFARAVERRGTLMAWFDSFMNALWELELSSTYSQKRRYRESWTRVLLHFIVISPFFLFLGRMEVTRNRTLFVAASTLHRALRRALAAFGAMPRAREKFLSHLAGRRFPFDGASAHVVHAGLAEGRWYWEVVLAGPAGLAAPAEFRVGAEGRTRRTASFWSGPDFLVPVAGDRPPMDAAVTNDGAATPTHRVVRVAIDGAGRKMWVGTESGWIGDGDPSSGSAPTLDLAGEAFDPKVAASGGPAGWECGWSTDPKDWTFRPPAGFLSLPRPPVPSVERPSNSVLAINRKKFVIDTKGPIDSRLAQNYLPLGASISIRLDKPLGEGRWYWEVETDELRADELLKLRSITLGLSTRNSAWWLRLGSEQGDCAWRGDGYLGTGGTWVAWHAVAPSGKRTLRVAVDTGIGAVWFGDTSGWLGNGDPAARRSPALTGIRADAYPAFGIENTPHGIAPLRLKLRADELVLDPPAGYLPLFGARTRSS
jgi:hypothetical protein